MQQPHSSPDEGVVIRGASADTEIAAPPAPAGSAAATHAQFLLPVVDGDFGLRGWPR